MADESVGLVDPPVSDGRRRRGIEKRTRLLEAALRVIEAKGVAAASQRAVAAEANVSPTLVVYHFDTVEKMLAEALAMSNNRYLDQARSAIAQGRDPVEALAEMIAASVDSNHAAIAEFELCLQAARDPRLRKSLEQWWHAVDEMLRGAVPDAGRRRVLMLAADGMFLRQIVPGQRMERPEILAILRSVASGH